MKKSAKKIIRLFLMMSFLFGCIALNVFADTYTLPSQTNDSSYFYVFTNRELVSRNSLPLRAHAFLLNVPKGGQKSLEQSVTTTGTIQFSYSQTDTTSITGTAKVSDAIGLSVGASSSVTQGTQFTYSIAFTTKQGWVYSFPADYNNTSYNSCDFYTAVGYDRYVYTVERYQAIHWVKYYWLFGWHAYDDGYDKGSYIDTITIPVDLPKDVTYCVPDTYLKSTGAATPSYLGGEIIDGSKYVTKPEGMKGVWKFEGNALDLSNHNVSGTYTMAPIILLVKSGRESV